MLIDATNPEETRVAITRDGRVEEYDFISSTRQQIKDNFYLAKVTRIEPSLQAAFVEYGGNRQGFLPFSEIHPDYYQIPLSDREALNEALAARKRAAREAAARADRDVIREPLDRMDVNATDTGDGDPVWAEADAAPDSIAQTIWDNQDADTGNTGFESTESEAALGTEDAIAFFPESEQEADEEDEDALGNRVAEEGGESSQPARTSRRRRRGRRDRNGGSNAGSSSAPREREREREPEVERFSDRDRDEEFSERTHYDFYKRYHIQEVIKHGQILLVQAVKEERGTKGAAMTTYLSLAGRYCVLMPNTADAGGVSRKIRSLDVRRRLRDILDDIEVDDGMSVIIRTAGSDRSKEEIKRDFEYLRRQWNEIREQTLSSSAPALIHEENDLIKRAIRDQYDGHIDGIWVEGQEGFDDAQSFMKNLMPSHTDKVKHYTDNAPLFEAYNVEQQLGSLFSPIVNLRSGGYVVINPTEALVAIDVNSGRSTKEHSIEETAVKTNIEAAAEIARQLRLRDLAGLLVIDFIDMMENRNRRAVERALKDALRKDRAKIQLGRISPFGLLEMSRQRLRPSIGEINTLPCPHCDGSGVMRSVESFGIELLRRLRKVAADGQLEELAAKATPDVALYLLNQKREQLLAIEQQFGVRVRIEVDTLASHRGFTFEVASPRRSSTPRPQRTPQPVIVQQPEAETAPSSTTAPQEASGERTGRRRRRRRGGAGGADRRPEALDAPMQEETFQPDAGVPENLFPLFNMEVSHGFDDAAIPEPTDDNIGNRVGDAPKAAAPKASGDRRRRKPAATHPALDAAPFLPETANQPARIMRMDDEPAPAAEAKPAPRKRASRAKAAPRTTEGAATPPANDSGAEEESGPKRNGWWQRLLEP
jgi:ribonuclease E